MTIDLQKAVLTFAQEVQDLLDSVLPRPDDVPPEDRQVQVPFIEGRYSVRVAADHARIALTKNGARVGHLRVTYQCTSDTAQTYLAVHKSTFELLGFSDRQPIARLDYVRDAYTAPAAHWNIHAERGTVSRLLGRTNPPTMPASYPLCTSRSAVPGCAHALRISCNSSSTSSRSMSSRMHLPSWARGGNAGDGGKWAPSCATLRMKRSAY